ncbi:amino acid amidase [Sporanaerobium hydrogeniformans]|uniref:Amino acid amidase n=1 Tax=Sporanaerobium hydrogeniformans TaxID=3072179 RepID=A0AC61DGC1_9FIRM|nr:M55 family metallopeptidase [Sporanaerobium hydrogeniformans]PHV71843.1 amino acid amidase [Sporanaerobium hydrogeniformans]
MRLYISADLEGITGVSKWEETHKGNGEYEKARLQMTREVAAACLGALEAGADFIMVKDAHEDGKNLIHNMLPKEVKLLSGWSNHPYNMVEGLDASFDGVLMIGYHSGGHSNGSPLAHTLSIDSIRSLTLNGKKADEFLLYAEAAHFIGVPVIGVSGDGELIRRVKGFDSQIKTVAVQEGFGGAIVSIHPELAIGRIQKMAKKAVENATHFTMSKKEHYELKIEFKAHQDAYKYSFYPGVEQIGEYAIRLATSNYGEILALLLFI